MEDSHRDWKIIKHPLYQPRSPPWLDLRVLYIRLTGFEASKSVPEVLKITHIPLTPNTIVEVNGRRSSIYSESVSSSLRRDRVDWEAEEATYVGTDSIRLTGSAMLEVCNEENLLVTVTLELSNGDGGEGEEKGRNGKWRMSCRAVSGSGFVKKAGDRCDLAAEIYVTGHFSGSPIILTRTVKLGFPKKARRKKTTLDAIPEYDEARLEAKIFQDVVAEEEYGGLYKEADTMDEEGGELSWFNAGVRVGVGIGLGICLGVGLLARTYSTATKSFMRRLI
ncbi:uncharacterized protein At1g01500-like isoform X2 [Wolffia australiana]